MISITTEACTGCSMCLKVCPHGVWVIQEGKATLGSPERCIECGACQLNCHDGAISVTKGTGCLVEIIREDIMKKKTAQDGEAYC